MQECCSTLALMTWLNVDCLKGFAGLMCIVSAELCMDSHDLNRISTGRNSQYWRSLGPVMHLHENHYIKRAGVAGIRARAQVFTLRFEAP